MKVGGGATSSSVPNRPSSSTWLFEAYSTGEWTIDSLLGEATDRGLRSRGRPNTTSKVISRSQLNRILSNPYFKGIVRFNGVEYQGKHQPIVDERSWQRVQDVLTANRYGVKQREHPHYLKNTIFCGHCGSRLCVTRSRSKTGRYCMYYFCIGRHQKRTTCMLKHRPLTLVEEQIEDHYRTVNLSAAGPDETAAAILAELESQQAEMAADHERQQERLRSLDDERTKLLHAHYAGAVPLDLLKREQERIAHEMSAAEHALRSASQGISKVERVVAKAVRWAQNCHEAYLTAGPTERRLLNQAFFKKVLDTEEGVVCWEYQQPFAALMSAHDSELVSHKLANGERQWQLDGGTT